MDTVNISNHRDDVIEADVCKQLILIPFNTFTNFFNKIVRGKARGNLKLNAK